MNGPQIAEHQRGPGTASGEQPTSGDVERRCRHQCVDIPDLHRSVARARESEERGRYAQLEESGAGRHRCNGEKRELAIDAHAGSVDRHADVIGSIDDPASGSEHSSLEPDVEVEHSAAVLDSQGSESGR